MPKYDTLEKARVDGSICNLSAGEAKTEGFWDRMDSQPKLIATRQKNKVGSSWEETLKADFRPPHTCAQAHLSVFTQACMCPTQPHFPCSLKAPCWFLSLCNGRNRLLFAQALNVYILFSFFLSWTRISPSYPGWFQSGGLRPFSCVSLPNGKVLLLRQEGVEQCRQHSSDFIREKAVTCSLL